MPELPDVTIYLEALRPRVVGQPLERVRLASPFVLRSVDPPLAPLIGRRGRGRCAGSASASCFGFGDDLYARHPPDDRRPPALGAPRRQTARQDRPGGLRLSHRHAAAHRSEPEEARRALRRARRRSAGRARSRRPRGARRRRSTSSAPRCGARTTRSSARSPIRVSSAASATRTRTRSCTPRGCRRSS